jgi:hypothetical protein
MYSLAAARERRSTLPSSLRVASRIRRRPLAQEGNRICIDQFLINVSVVDDEPADTRSGGHAGSDPANPEILALLGEDGGLMLVLG